MTSKVEQTERTRGALLEAARALFAEQGFGGTSTEAVVRRAGVTRGALYHHFADKTALYDAVYEDVERGLIEGLTSRLVPTGDPVDILHAAVDAFFDATSDPAVRRIALLEGPSVVGWQRWHEVQERYGLGLTKAALQGAMAAGALRQMSVDALAHVLLGGLVEAAMAIASSDDPAASRAEFGAAVHLLLDALRP